MIEAMEPGERLKSRRAFLRWLAGGALLAGVGGTAIGTAAWQILTRLDSGHGSAAPGVSFASPSPTAWPSPTPPPATATAGALAPVISQGDTSKARIALTFDDGFYPEAIESVLDVCAGEGMQLTFFPKGALLERRPDLWRRAVDEGHEIGNHTFDHTPLTYFPPDDPASEGKILDQIDRWQEALDVLLGSPHPARYLRPPGGMISDVVRAVVAKRGLQIVLWTVDSGSVGGAEADQIVVNVTGGATNGAIVLMHFIPSDVAALPAIVSRLKADGFTLTTVSGVL
jgi:peptidoglycan/xylan/chitin deacetylase (PgdA/CDA1 family)